ncbi:GyrI-like domain-containing protein [Arthrobacter sp. HLT1-20]
MDKYDVKKAHKELFAPSAKDFSLVDVPWAQYLAIDGHGNPGTSAAYTEALEALYATAYGVKFASKNGLGRDFVVAPLEGLWWAADMGAFTAGDKDQWDWTMMISQPGWITQDLVAGAVEQAAAKKKALPGLDRLRVMELEEGLCVQILHIGPYDDEAPTLARLHERFMPANGLAFNGKHHEIYLGDPRRAAPEKLKTILRQPVVRR